MGIVVVEPGKILSFYFFCLQIFHPGLQWLDLMWSLISEVRPWLLSSSFVALVHDQEDQELSTSGSLKVFLSEEGRELLCLWIFELFAFVIFVFPALLTKYAVT